MAKGQLPRPGNKGHHKANQKVIEKFEHVAQNCRKDNAALIAGKVCLTVQVAQHIEYVALMSISASFAALT